MSSIRLAGLPWLLALTTCARAPIDAPRLPAPVPRDSAAARLEATVRYLAEDLGERNVQRHPEALQAAADHLDAAFRAQGHTPRRQEVPTPFGPTYNLIVTVQGASSDLFVVGAHYDTAAGTPGADDNGSGVAALVELGRRFADTEPPWTLELVAWTNEEPPWFRRDAMGSAHHALALKGREDRGEVRVKGVWSLETIGYYDDRPGSQRYLGPMGIAYPSEGNYLGFVGNLGSRSLVAQSRQAFEASTTLPAEQAVLPGWITGVDWSDHRSYWPHGMEAAMITDTALFRNPHYHEATDRLDTLDVERLALAVDGLEGALWRMMQP